MLLQRLHSDVNGGAWFLALHVALSHMLDNYRLFDKFVLGTLRPLAVSRCSNERHGQVAVGFEFFLNLRLMVVWVGNDVVV